MLWAMRGRGAGGDPGVASLGLSICLHVVGNSEGEVQGDAPLLVCKSRKGALLAEVRGTGGRIIWGEVDASGTQVWPCRK